MYIDNNTIKNLLDELDFSQPLSLKTIIVRAKYNNKKINKRYMMKYLCKNENYELVNPLSVGSQKNFINVWKKIN